MQKMKKSLITVPINVDAELALAHDRATSDQLIELELKADDFYQLWNEGIFDLINTIAQSQLFSV